MDKKIYFGKWETTCILITMLGTKTILNLPILNIELAGTAGWILPLYCGIIALILFLFIEKLYEPFSGKDFIEVAEIAGGRILSIISGLIVLVLLVAIVSNELRIFSEEMKAMAYSNTPISFIMVIFMTGVIISVFLGLEAIVRYHAILVPVSIGAFVLFLLILFPYYDARNIFPLLGTGVKSILVNGFVVISDYFELILVFFMVPHLRKFNDLKKAGSVSIIIVAIVMTGLTAAYISVYGYYTALSSFLPAYRLGRIIDFGRYLEKSESILIITWSTMALMYLSGGFFFIVHIFSRLFKLNYYKPLILPFTIIIFTLSLLPDSLMQTIRTFFQTFRRYSWLVTFVLITMILVIARVRIKSSKDKNMKGV